MAEINYWAVLVAAVSAFMLGGIWYSPMLFGSTWQRETGMSEEKARESHPAKVFGGAFVLSLLAAYVFAVFLGMHSGEMSWLDAAFHGFVVGLFWVASSFGINYLFAQRAFKLWLVDGGYHTVQFTLYGLIVGLWR